MTLSIAWIRTVSNGSELVFASDSRLSGGGNVDHCQKVFSLPREDCCISFSGRTTIAYPFILQLQNTIADNRKVFDRAVDITILKGRVVSLLNRFIGDHKDTIEGDFENDLIGTSFLFGGWSWKYSKFYLWRIFWERSSAKYIGASTGVWKAYDLPQTTPVPVAFIGDYTTEFVRGVGQKISQKIDAARRGEKIPELDYEPLCVLAEMLTDATFTDRKRELKGLIGGGPQVAKVYSFLRTMHYAVEWDIGPKFVYVLKGRVVSDYETLATMGINPFTGKATKPVKGPPEDFVAFQANRTIAP